MTNSEIAQKLRDLRDFLIIAGYEESHATRYTHIARTIEKMPESVEQMRREARLTEIPQVGKLIAMYIRELIDTGTCSKIRDWESTAPYTVIEMCRVPGLGPRTAHVLFEGYGIKSLAELQQAVREGKLDEVVSEKLRSAVLATILGP
jgi:DNA polymerase (family X)